MPATVDGSDGSPLSWKPVPVTEIPLTVPVPVPWFKIWIVAVVATLMSTEGKLSVAPLESVWTLLSAKVYCAMKFGAAPDPESGKMMLALLEVIVSTPELVPAACGVNTTVKDTCCPASTVVGVELVI